MPPEMQNGDRFETQSPPSHSKAAHQNGTPMTRELHLQKAESWLDRAEQYWEQDRTPDAALAAQIAAVHAALAGVAPSGVVRYTGREARR